jgi:hypothetical protein
MDVLKRKEKNGESGGEKKKTREKKNRGRKNTVLGLG